jgi:D-alanyl-lipoteichoic acid acyltransferase DltB (MBOAT superfamily)
VGVVFYAFQIYCDFSGYSDIAIGAARILGFRFPVNFDKPYFSRSFSEFWTRWHVSLSSWLRDYLYIPLGGNRGGSIRTHRNLMIVMLLGGLWHGANWTFVIWGALHGSYLILQRTAGGWWDRFATGLGLGGAARAAVAMLAVFALTCFAWIFFRAPTLGSALDVIGRFGSAAAWANTRVPMAFDVAKGALLIGLLLTAEVLGTRPVVRATLERSGWARLATASAMLWCIALFGTFAGTRFIYFQF